MQWLLLAVALGLVGWASWRMYEAYQFAQLLDSLSGELTNPKVQYFMDQLESRQVPNSKSHWDRLRILATRMQGAGGVDSQTKSEFWTLLKVKGVRF